MRTLFLSLPGLMEGLLHGLITEEDLQEGIFYLRSVERVYMLQDEDEEIDGIFKDSPDQKKACYDRVQKAIDRALEHRRAILSEENELSGFGILKDLLSSLGYPEILIDDFTEYSPVTAKRFIEQSGMGLRVYIG